MFPRGPRSSASRRHRAPTPPTNPFPLEEMESQRRDRAVHTPPPRKRRRSAPPKGRGGPSDCGPFSSGGGSSLSLSLCKLATRLIPSCCVLASPPPRGGGRVHTTPGGGALLLVLPPRRNRGGVFRRPRQSRSFVAPSLVSVHPPPPLVPCHQPSLLPRTTVDLFFNSFRHHQLLSAIDAPDAEFLALLASSPALRRK